MDKVQFAERLEERISQVIQEMLKENTDRTIDKVDMETHYPSGTIFLKVKESK